MATNNPITITLTFDQARDFLDMFRRGVPPINVSTLICEQIKKQFLAIQYDDKKEVRKDQ